VVLDFWMHSIYKYMSKIFGIFMQKWRLDLGLCFVYVHVDENLFPSLFIYSRYYSVGPNVGYVSH
jgi:hypothetical protein